MRDRVVFGIYSPHVREKLLNQGAELTLGKAIDIARSHAVAQAQMRSMAIGSTNANQEQQVHAIGKHAKLRQSWQKSAKTNSVHTERLHTCGYCEKEHKRKETWPAKGKQCAKRGKWNHFAKVCKSKSKSVHIVSDNKPEDGYPNVSSEFFIDSVTNTITSSEQAFAEVEIKEYGSPLKFKLDTGAQVNVIPERVFKNIATKMLHTHKKLTGYGGQPMSVKGTCQLHCKYKENAMPLDFFIVDTQSPPVLGLKACLDLDMIKLVLSVSSPAKDSESIIDEFADVWHWSVSWSMQHSAGPNSHTSHSPTKESSFRPARPAERRVGLHGGARYHCERDRANRLGKCPLRSREAQNW